MKFQCPHCSTEMLMKENKHICPNVKCKTTLSLKEANELFEDGKIIGLLEDNEIEKYIETLAEGKMKKEADGEEDDMKKKDDEEDMAEEGEEDDMKKKDDEEDKEKMKAEGKKKKMKEAEEPMGNPPAVKKVDDEADDVDVSKVDEKGVEAKMKAEGKKMKKEAECDDEEDMAEEGEKDDEEKMKAEAKKKMKKEMTDKDGFNDDDEAELDIESFDVDSISVNVDEDVAAIFNGSTLSEGFTKKAAKIYKTALVTKIKEVVAKLEEQKVSQVKKAVAKNKQVMEEKMEDYLDYSIKEWMEANKIPLMHKTRVEMNESFMAGLVALMKEHYVEVPGERYDILEAMSEENDKLKTDMDKLAEKNMNLQKQLDKITAKTIVAEISEGLADTQKEKLAKLADNVSFVDAESFKAEVADLKESYFGKKTSQKLEEEVDPSKLNDKDKIAESSDLIAKAARNLGKREI